MAALSTTISHSPIWSSSAIFVEEDDAQTGVDHVDGHRSPGYIISPYVNQSGVTDHTFYTQVNMTRTIEQILGLTPMNQNDLVASPMRTAFIDNPPADNFQPWTHVANGIPLNSGVTQTPTQTAIPASLASAAVKPQTIVTESPAVKALRAGWMKKKAEIFAGKYHMPDSEDPDTVNHLIWYEATGLTASLPRREEGSPGERLQQRCTRQSRRRRLNRVPAAISPLPAHRGEGFFVYAMKLPKWSCTKCSDVRLVALNLLVGISAATRCNGSNPGTTGQSP